MTRRDLKWAAAVALVILAFFVITLRPGVGGTEDSPKFQFVGRVLGTSHSPGYPFYAMATYVFGWLPIGTLAYRINLFSAVCGTLACICIYLTARRIGVTHVLSAAAALGAASSYPVWSNSVTAEVYTLAAFTSACAILFLVGFVQTGQLWRLYAGCAVWACGFGNHLTIAGILPAAVIYGVWMDRRVLQPRIAITSALIGIMGVLQYAFIAIRTLQGAPYLEARATTLLGVFNVIIAKDVEWARFYQAQSTVAKIEVPMLLNGVRIHMGTIPLALAVLAIIIAIRKRNAHVLVIAGAAAGTLAFVANLWGDVVGFITPVCVQLWPLAALGLQEGYRAIRPSGDRRDLGFGAVSVAALAWPVVQGVMLWPSIDLLRQPGEGPGVQALYSHLPMKSAIVVENYWLARHVNYFHFSGEVQPDPNPRVLSNDVAAVRTAMRDGLDVFAFEGATQWLNAQGLNFERSAIARLSLAAWMKQQHRGTLVVVSAAGRAMPFDLLPQGGRGQRPANYSVLTTVVGGTTTIEQNDAKVSVSMPSLDGRLLAITADDSGPRIVVGDDVIAAVDRGLAVTAIAPGGGVLGRWTFGVDETPGIDFPPPAYVLRGTNDHCVSLTPGTPADITPILDEGRASIGIPGFGKGTITIEGDQPSSSWRFWMSHGRGTSTIDRARAQLVFEGYQGTRPVFALSMPPGPTRVIATFRSEQLASVDMCRLTTPHLPETGALDVDADNEGLFSGGWHLAERGGSQHFRWSQRQSTLTWRMDRADRMRLLLHMRPANANGATLQAAVNGNALPACTLKPGQWTECEIDIAATLLHQGINQMSLASDTMAPASEHPGDPRELAFVMQASRVRVGQ
mgnify:CR=1 FL=1